MFTPISMGTNRMLEVDNLVPLTTNNFEIRIYDISGNAPTENAEMLTLSTDEIGEITEEQDVITVHYGNGILKFPSKVTFQDVEWTLNCYCAPSTLEPLREWRQKVYDNKTEKMGLPSEYMRTVYFIKYDGQGNVRDVIKCRGTWIAGLKNGAMNQQGGELVKVGVTLVISKVEYLTASELGT